MYNMMYSVIKKSSPTSFGILLSSVVVLVVSVVLAASEDGLSSLGHGRPPSAVDLPEGTDDNCPDLNMVESKSLPPTPPEATSSSGGFRMMGTPLPDIDRSVLIQAQKEGKKVHGPPRVISDMEESLDALGTYLQAISDADAKKQQAYNEKNDDDDDDTVADEETPINVDYNKIPYERGGLLVTNKDTHRHTTIGVRQITGVNQYERAQTQQKIDGMISYLKDIVLVDRRYAAYGLCKNQHESCAFWASRGECSMNPSYMIDQGNCVLACLECPRLPDHYITQGPDEMLQNNPTKTHPKMPNDKTQRERDTERYEESKRKRMEQEKFEALRKAEEERQMDEYRRKTAHLTEKFNRQAAGVHRVVV